jgi:hypothetical protein
MGAVVVGSRSRIGCWLTDATSHGGPRARDVCRDWHPTALGVVLTFLRVIVCLLVARKHLCATLWAWYFVGAVLERTDCDRGQDLGPMVVFLIAVLCKGFPTFQFPDYESSLLAV